MARVRAHETAKNVHAIDRCTDRRNPVGSLAYSIVLVGKEPYVGIPVYRLVRRNTRDVVHPCLVIQQRKPKSGRRDGVSYIN